MLRGLTPGCALKELFLSVLREADQIPGIKPQVAASQASTFLIVLSLQPWLFNFQISIQDPEACSMYKYMTCMQQTLISDPEHHQ